MGIESFVIWRSFLKEVCALKLIQNPIRLGGPGVQVQIDESLFVRRKNNRGRGVRQEWVFGSIDSETKECILVPVPNRNSDTLRSIIQSKFYPKYHFQRLMEGIQQ
jgi:hypothetical protein